MSPNLVIPGARASELCIELRTLVDVRVAHATIRRFVADSGFDPRRQWEVTIAASEAGTNMVKYAGGGRLRMLRIVDPRVGVRLEARDFGPGIGDLARALEDHVSEGYDVRVREAAGPIPRGLGMGLGAIRRMMDSVGWENLGDGGLLWAEKWLAR